VLDALLLEAAAADGDIIFFFLIHLENNIIFVTFFTFKTKLF